MLNNLQPGPKYMLRSTVGFNDHDPTLKRSPAFSLGFRYPDPRITPKSYSPPSIKYNCNGLYRKGVITVKGGNFGTRTDVERIPHGPSPLSYFPRFDNVMKSSPSVSLASRPKQLNVKDPTPGANKYLIPHSIGKSVTHLKTAPAYSVLGRFHDKYKGSDTPNALSYPAVNCDVYKKKLPDCPMIGRPPKKLRGSMTPAPNAYFPILSSYKPNIPSVALGNRTKNIIPKFLLDDGYEDIKIEPHELEPY